MSLPIFAIKCTLTNGPDLFRYPLAYLNASHHSSGPVTGLTSSVPAQLGRVSARVLNVQSQFDRAELEKVKKRPPDDDNSG